MNECHSSVYEPHRSKIGSSKKIVGERKYTSMNPRKSIFYMYSENMRASVLDVECILSSIRGKQTVLGLLACLSFIQKSQNRPTPSEI